MEDGVGERGQNEDAEEEREDAQGAAEVEVADAVRLVACVVEDAGDQEAGEDEEEVHASPAPRHIEVVLGEDEKEGHGAEAVERGIVGGPYCRRKRAPGEGGCTIGGQLLCSGPIAMNFFQDTEIFLRSHQKNKQPGGFMQPERGVWPRRRGWLGAG